MNFRTVEVKAYSAQEAQIKGPFEAYAAGANCTLAWKKAGSPTDVDSLNEFMEQQLEKKTKFNPGLGLYIILENGYRNKSLRPYKFKNKKNIGHQKYNKRYLLIGDDKKIIREIVSSRKFDAVKAAREEYAEGYKGNIEIVAVKTPEDNVVGKFEYTPSKGTNEGRYLLFGTVGTLATT